MKKMVVNCAICDMRNVTEETLQNYEQVVVNSATVLLTPGAKELINRHNVVLNAAEVLEVPDGENVRVNTQNGVYELTCREAPPADQIAILMVNGSLTVGPDALEAAKAYHKIKVNGTVLLPRSLAGKLSNLSVNGSTSVYPDGAILLKRNALLDRTFPLRARENALYWAARRLVFTDTTLDVKKLADKRVRFASREALLAESLAEAVTPLLTEDTDITVVPDGTVFVNDDVRMTGRFIKKCGTRAYINGDLIVDQDAADVLPQLEYLYVNGDVKLPEALADAFEDVKAQYDELVVLKRLGKIIQDQVKASVDRGLLEKFSDGITVTDCAYLVIAPDVPAELILERLHVSDCGVIHCTPQQEAAVGAICSDVGQIETEGKGSLTGNVWDALKGSLSEDTKMVNAAEYVM